MKLKENEKNIEYSDDDFEKKEKRSKKILEKPPKVLSVIWVTLCIIIILGILFSKGGKVTTISESALKEMVESDEFSTVEYTYNSIVSVNNDKNEEMYHVAYQGIVKLGFDFNEIKITDNQNEKKIYIDIPDIKINSVNIDESSLDYIFTKDKYNTETIFQESYRKSYEDLEVKAENNVKLKEMARENAIVTIDALIKPLEAQLPDDYEIEYK